MQRILLVLLLVFAVYAGKTALDAVRTFAAVRELHQLATQLEETDTRSPEALARARGSLEQASGALAALQMDIWPLRPLLPLMGWMPWLGAYIELTPQLIDVAAPASRAADQATAALAPLLVGMQDGTSIQQQLPVLVAQRPALEQAYAAAGEAEAQWQALSGKPLPSRLAALQQLDKGLPALRQALGATLMLPQLLGAGGQQTYLLLGQNSDELRATGGFIGTAGLLTVEAGDVKRLDYRDSYSFDSEAGRPFITPPEPYQRYLLAEDWRLRDSNWWADFPTSARHAAELLRLDQREQVDGVMAYDQQLLVKVLSVLGTIALPEYGERISADNVLQLLDIYAHPPGYRVGDTGEDLRRVVTDDRKGIIRALAAALVARLDEATPAELMGIAQAVRSALMERHLLITLNDPSAAAMLRDIGWDGSVAPPSDSDYLMAVETNVGYSKANRYVERSLDYRLVLGPDKTPVQATAAVTYRNTNAQPARHCAVGEVDFLTSDDSCYRSYVRVYAPRGSVPVGAEGIAGPLEWLEEGNATVFAGLMLLQPGETKTVRFSYIPPRSSVTAGQDYRLYVQKQPGSADLPVVVTLIGTREIQASVLLATDQRVRLPLP